MAKVSFSALVEEITGKLAGSVFQDSYGGFQIRTRVTPRNPQSKYQQLRRGEFGFLSASWRNLTSIQRQTWIDAAATPAGALNLFLQSNINLTLINEPTITDYVASSDPGSMTIEFAKVEGSDTDHPCPPYCGIMTVKATGGTTVVPAGTKLLLQVTYLKAPTKIFTNPSQYSPVISFDEGTDLSTQTDIITEWRNRYGVMMADKRLCLKANLIDKSNGRRGADQVQCTTSSEVTTYQQLASFTAPESASINGTNTLVTYSMPGGTLSAIGQRLRLVYSCTVSNSAQTSFVRPSIDGNIIQSVGNPSVGAYKIEIELIRTGSDSIRYISQQQPNAASQSNKNDEITGLDFTADMNINVVVITTAVDPFVISWGAVDWIRQI